MINDNHDLKAFGESNSEKTGKDAFFCDEDILNTCKNSEEFIKKHRVTLKKWHFLDYIREHPNCTIYEVAKQTKTNYSQAHQYMKEMVYMRLVALKQGFTKNGESCELFFIPIQPKKEGET